MESPPEGLPRAARTLVQWENLSRPQRAGLFSDIRRGHLGTHR